MCDGKPLLWRHLIALLLDVYLLHSRLQFEYGISWFIVLDVAIRRAVCFGNEL
jgi:hypothetical protein